MPKKRNPLQIFVGWVICFLLCVWLLPKILDAPLWIIFWTLVLPTAGVLNGIRMDNNRIDAAEKEKPTP